MVIPLDLQRNGTPWAGFLGVSCRADYERSLQALESVLGPTEKACFDQLRFPRRRRSYLMGRIALKRAAGRLLEEPQLEKLEILSGVFQQPLLHYSFAAAPEISLAHCRGLAVGVAARSGHLIGIDLEFIDPAREDAFASVFTRDELAMLESLALPPIHAAFALWTMREGLSKVLRCGLTASAEALCAKEMKSSGTQPGSVSCEAEFKHFAQYKARSWIVAGYVMSIVIPKSTTMGFTPDEALVGIFEQATAASEAD